MTWCACGNSIPDGFKICPECEAFGDDDPLPMDRAEEVEDTRLSAMDDEAYWFGMTCWGDDDERKEAA